MLRAGVLIKRGEKLFSRVHIAGLGQCVHFFLFFGEKDDVGSVPES